MTAIFICQENIIKAHRTHRLTGYIVHVGPSRSAGFWTTIREDGTGEPFFGYGRNFTTHPNPPKIGWCVEFTPLPAMVGTKLGRATEVKVLSSKPQRDEIVLVRIGKATRIVARCRQGERVLGEFTV